MAKGRPVEQTAETQPRKFIREFKFDDGRSQKWHYDLDKSPNGPIEVELFYPKEWFKDEIDEVENDKLPKTKRKYLNPANGKLVAYTRAKELGII
jgi:hypothetical protein